MTDHLIQKSKRIMAIAPTTRGFGFAILDGDKMLADWGVKRIAGRDKNDGSLAQVKKLLDQYEPDVLVLQDASHKPFRRASRIRALTSRIIALAGQNEIMTKLFTFEKTRQVFFGNSHGTKRSLAELLAKQFPEELGKSLPPTNIFEIALPRRSIAAESNAWINLATNGFMVVSETNGLRTTIEFVEGPNSYKPWGLAWLNGQGVTNVVLAGYRITHTASSTNYLYKVEGLGAVQVGTTNMSPCGV